MPPRKKKPAPKAKPKAEPKISTELARALEILLETGHLQAAMAKVKAEAKPEPKKAAAKPEAWPWKEGQHLVTGPHACKVLQRWAWLLLCDYTDDLVAEEISGSAPPSDSEGVSAEDASLWLGHVVWFAGVTGVSRPRYDTDVVFMEWLYGRKLGLKVYDRPAPNEGDGYHVRLTWDYGKAKPSDSDCPLTQILRLFPEPAR